MLAGIDQNMIWDLIFLLYPRVWSLQTSHKLTTEPSLLIHVFSFRKLAVFDTWSRLVVHVAMDNTVIIEEISECCCSTRNQHNLRKVLT